jgi:putative PIN family toxin of toxin-antitoxin system
MRPHLSEGVPATVARPPDGGPVVLDTNIVLDLWVFANPITQPLREALASGALRWHSTASMREELARVLAYPHLASRMARQAQDAPGVLAGFDRCAQLVPPAPKALWTCKDPDDQKFVDLAIHLRATLLSKDRAVLCMARRLARAGVAVGRAWTPVAEPAGVPAAT